MYKNMLKYVPQLSILIIILGLIKQILYYYNFNLPINYFLGISELGVIVSNDLLFFIPALFILYLFVVNEYTIFNVLKYEAKSKSNEDSFDRVKHVKETKSSSIVLGILISIFSFIFYLMDVYYIRLYIIAIGILLSFVFLVSLFIYQFHKVFTEKETKTSILFIVTVFVVIIGKTGYDINQVIDGKYTGTTIVTTEKTYPSNDSSYFIGKTEKYVFIYNSYDTTCDVIPTDKITFMKIKTDD